MVSISLRATHTRPDNTRELLLADAEQQSDRKGHRPDDRDGESRNQPELRADVLLLAHISTPVLRLSALLLRALAGLDDCCLAAAHEAAQLVVRAVLVGTLAVRGAVACGGHAGVEGTEALRDFDGLGLSGLRGGSLGEDAGGGDDGFGGAGGALRVQGGRGVAPVGDGGVAGGLGEDDEEGL